MSDLLQQLILRRFNEGVASDHLLVDILPGGVIIFDSGSNPGIRQLTALDVTGLSQALALQKLLSAQNLFAITGLTGGGAANLDGQPTAGGAQSAGALIAVELTTGVISLYRLRIGSTTTSAPNSIRPLDYDVVTNQVYWALVATAGSTIDITQFAQWKPNITALNSAGSAGLDAVPTVNLPVTATLYEFVNSSIPGLVRYQLIAGTNATGGFYQRPADYNASTNAKVWFKVG